MNYFRIPILIITIILGIGTQGHSSSKIICVSGINLLDPPGLSIYREVSLDPNTSLSTSAQFGLCNSYSFADTNFYQNTSVYSQNIGLSYPSWATAFYESRYKILGNDQDLIIPMTFNHKLKASLHVWTDPGNMGSVALASVHYHTYASICGCAMLASQAGIPVLFGGLLGEIQTTITPIVSIENTIKNLNNEDLLTLGLKINLNSFETDFSTTASIIATAIKVLGIDRLNIIPGLNVKVGFDIEHYIDTEFSLPQNVNSTGVVRLIIQSSGSSSITKAKAHASFKSNSSTFNNITLESITVPSDYDLINPDDLLVVFDSGLIMEVTRAPSLDTNQDIVIGNLTEAIDIIGMLVNVLKNENMGKAFTNKINAVLQLIIQESYQEALDKLESDILGKTNGCAEINEPDNNDWVLDCTSQDQIYPRLLNIIQLLQNLI